jgi:hypothetical protein
VLGFDIESDKNIFVKLYLNNDINRCYSFYVYIKVVIIVVTIYSYAIINTSGSYPKRSLKNMSRRKRYD